MPTTALRSEATDDGPTNLAKSEDVVIGEVGGQTLSVDAVEEDGEVTGEFRVDNVVVTIQCTGTRSLTGSDSNGRDLILGGEVTDNPDGLARLDEVNVAMGDLVALIVRENGRVTLYAPSLWYGEQATAGSCNDLVESVPSNLDGGFFDGGVLNGAGIDFVDDVEAA